MTEPRKHHSVPQSLLRRFASPHNGEQIFVYDKQSGRTFLGSIGDIGAERDFYSVELPAGRFNWEPFFQLLDDRLAVVLGDLARLARDEPLPTAVRSSLPLLVATQVLRTHLQRTSPTEVLRQLNERGADLGVEPLTLSDTQSRLLHFERLFGIDEVAATLHAKDVVLFEIQDPENPLWLSDNPVILFNSLAHGFAGVSAPGIEIYLPVGPRRCVAFYCPSIAAQIRESLDATHPRPQLNDRFYTDLLQGIEGGRLVRVDSAFADFLNERQVIQSSRFLYSPTRTFALAEQVLEANDDLRDVKSNITVGSLGGPLRPMGAMPSGTFLLLEYGNRHHMLAVHDRSARESNEAIVVVINDLAKWACVAKDMVYDCATLIVDGHAVRGSREVKLSEEHRDGEGVVVITHADPALQALMTAIGSRAPAT